MIQKLPKKLIVGLASIAVASFTLSMFLETYQLTFRQSHPITVNLLSGVVGFCCGVLVVAVGLNWFAEQERLVARRGDLGRAMFELMTGINSVVGAVPLALQTITKQWVAQHLIGNKQYKGMLLTDPAALQAASQLPMNGNASQRLEIRGLATVWSHFLVAAEVAFARRHDVKGALLDDILRDEIRDFETKATHWLNTSARSHTRDATQPLWDCARAQTTQASPAVLRSIPR